MTVPPLVHQLDWPEVMELSLATQSSNHIGRVAEGALGLVDQVRCGRVQHGGGAEPTRPRSSLDSSTSVTTTASAPAARAATRQSSPIGPAPSTATRLPGPTPRGAPACTGVASGSISAASSNDSPSGRRCKPVRARPRTRRPSRPRSGSRTRPGCGRCCSARRGTAGTCRRPGSAPQHHPVALGEVGHPGADGRDHADHLVPRRYGSGMNGCLPAQECVSEPGRCRRAGCAPARPPSAGATATATAPPGCPRRVHHDLAHRGRTFGTHLGTHRCLPPQ